MDTFLAALVASSRLPSAKSLRRWPSIPVNSWRSNLPGKSPTAAIPQSEQSFQVCNWRRRGFYCEIIPESRITL